MKKTSKQFTVCLKIYVGLGERKKIKSSRAVVVRAFNPSTWKAEAGGSL